MRRLWIPTLALLAAGAAGLAIAQDAQPGSGPVTLVYKFKPGTITRQQVKMKGEMTMAMGAIGSQPGQTIPMLMDMTMIMNSKVAGVAATGDATIVKTPTTLSMTMNVMGQNIEIKTVNGRATMIFNGRPSGAGAPGMPDMGAMLNTPVTLKMTPLGQVVETKTKGLPNPSGGAGGLEGLMGMDPSKMFGGGNAFTLPDKPVSVGDKWEKNDLTPFPAPAPGATGPQMQMSTTNTLRSLEVKNGKTIATIESVGRMGLAGAGAQASGKFTIAYTGTTLFDVTSGDMVRSVMQMNMDIDLGALLGGLFGGAGGAGGARPGAPGGAIPSMSVQGNIEISESNLPPAPPAPAGKKPAPATRSTTKK